MKKGLFFTLLALAAGFVFGVAQASAWQRDPDTVVDAAALTTAITQLLAPDPTIGDTDTTDVGVGTDAVGIDDSLTNPPADPADKDPGHTYYVDNTPGTDCPATPYVNSRCQCARDSRAFSLKMCHHLQ